MKKYIKKWDILLIIIVIFVSLITLICLKTFSVSGNTVNIKVNGNTVQTLPINEDTTYDIKKNNKIIAKVNIKDGYVFVSDATCPDKICENHKKINTSGDSIICLPNKIVVSIENDKNEVDGVAR